MVMAALLNYTAEMVRALPDDGKRYEVVDGELLVTPAPTRPHQRAAFECALLLRRYALAQTLGEVLMAPADFELDPRTMVQPDIFLTGLRPDGRPSTAWNDGSPLLLAVEVLSPSTARADRTTKRRRYQRAGIPEYWIADLDARTIERWRPADDRPEVLSDELVYQPAGALDPLVIKLKELFARIHGESRPVP